METALQSLQEIGRRLFAENFTGSITCADSRSTVQLWFVRGEIVHATSHDGSVGWEALVCFGGVRVEVKLVEPGELPPERSIRVSTERLLDALNHLSPRATREVLHVPLPLHARLQDKFSEIQRRIGGLRSLETHEAMSHQNAEKDDATYEHEGRSHSDRVVIEVTPRGAQWQHHSHGQELTISADSTVSTSDLMWAGEELRKEFNRLNREVPRNE